jgi:ElaB/YqjD/DUF883 family membrane-anchored ribosome-binding protein
MSDPTKSTMTDEPSLAHEFSAVLDDAQALLRHAGGEAGKGYADARARLETSVRSARERFGSLEETMLENARQARRDADDYVRSHAWESIAIGASVGLLLGLVLARR